jgi:hypothetical protein
MTSTAGILVHVYELDFLLTYTNRIKLYFSIFLILTFLLICITVSMVTLYHNLIYMIDVEMSVPETCSDMPIGTVLPWILLYKLIEK